MPKKKRSSSSNMSSVQNAAKTLFANIRFMSPDNPIRTIALTSSVPNEGKTTTSIELARAIATAGNSVLMVDCDMRRRSLANALGVHPGVGIYSVLTDAAPLTQAISVTPTRNMFFLDIEPNIPNPADILSSKRFHKLCALLKEQYDYVVYDTPPVGTFIDAAILSQLVDGVVLVARPGVVRREELENAYDQLLQANANVIGACATFVEDSGSDYYYYYYTEDGKRVKKNHGGGKRAAAQASSGGSASSSDGFQRPAAQRGASNHGR